MNTNPQPTRQRLFRGEPADQGGPLLLTIMFTFMIAALIIVIVATVMSGLNKSRNTRDFTQAQQIADLALNNALMQANKSGLTASSTGNSGAADANGITWDWKVNSGNLNAWKIEANIHTRSQDRTFNATLRGFPVKPGQTTYTTASDGKKTITYKVDEANAFTNGFLALDDFVGSGVNEIDGYSGGKGVVGANDIINIGSSNLDRVDQWNWGAAPDPNRCVGASCSTVTRTQLFPAAAYLTDPVIAKCGTVYPAWFASSGTALTANRCYASITFDTLTHTTIAGTVYSTGAITFGTPSSGPTNVNTSATTPNTAAKNLRIWTTGNVTIEQGSKIAAAIYAPNSTCTMNGDASVPATGTRWQGAAVCKTITLNQNNRLRYDGELAFVNAAASSSKYIYSLTDYTEVN